MVNISTQNVLAEANTFALGHGDSIGSETSGWIRNVVVRDSVLNGTNLAVRIKSERGRGGGVENVIYENLHGTVKSAVQLTLNYHAVDPTNASATPALRNVTLRNLQLEATESYLECDGLSDSIISDIHFENVLVQGHGAKERPKCAACAIHALDSKPDPHCTAPRGSSEPPYKFEDFELNVLPAWLQKFTIEYEAGLFAFHPDGTTPSLYGTIDVAHVLGTVGLLANFSIERRDAWASAIDSYQDAQTGFYKVAEHAPGHQPFHAAGEPRLRWHSSAGSLDSTTRTSRSWPRRAKMRGVHSTSLWRCQRHRLL